MLGAVKALASLDPAGCGLDGTSAQLEGRIYVMADEARLHFRVDRARRRTYGEDLVGALGYLSAVPPDAERCSRRSQSDAFSPFNNQSIDRAHPVAIGAFDFKSRASVSAARHASALIVMGAPTPRRRASSALHRITNVCSEFAGVPMEYVEDANPRPEPISIARCRELLGEEAESMTDQDIEDIRRHAETMACIMFEMYQEHCRFPE